MSDRVTTQYNKQQAAIRALVDLFSTSRICHRTQEAHIDAKLALRETPHYRHMTQRTLGYVEGYARSLEDAQLRSLFHQYRIIGTTEPFRSQWDNMSEAQKQACREGRTESALTWDPEGQHIFGAWRPSR